MEFSPSEAQEKTLILPQSEKLKIWEERGLSPDAVGVYGTSEEFLQTALATGFLTPQINEMSKDFSFYLEKLGKTSGSCIYFSLPFNERISLLKPEFVEQMEKSFPGFSSEQFKEETSLEESLISAKHYAQWNAYRHFLNEQLQLPLSSQSGEALLTLMYKTDLSKFKKIRHDLNGIGLYVNGYDPDEPTKEEQRIMRQVRARVDKQNLPQFLEKALNRRGVLVFYNKTVLENAVPGWEDEHEMVIVTEKPLSIDVIAGIERLPLK